MAGVTLDLPDLTGWQAGIPKVIPLTQQALAQRTAASTPPSTSGSQPAFSFSQSFALPRSSVEGPQQIISPFHISRAPRASHQRQAGSIAPLQSAFDPSGPFGTIAQPALHQPGPLVGTSKAVDQPPIDKVREQAGIDEALRQFLREEAIPPPKGTVVGPSKARHEGPIPEARVKGDLGGAVRRSSQEVPPPSLPARPEPLPADWLTGEEYRQWCRRRAERSPSPSTPTAGSMRPASTGMDQRFGRLFLQSQSRGAPSTSQGTSGSAERAVRRANGRAARGQGPTPEQSSPAGRRSAGSSSRHPGREDLGSSSGGGLASRLEPYSTYSARRGRGA
jgi:hypothetical protein